jgi:hypothetical protein
LPGLTVLGALLNTKVNAVPDGVSLGTVAVAVIFAAWAFERYRCLACHRFPELEMPLFDPQRRAHCGTALKRKCNHGADA